LPFNVENISKYRFINKLNQYNLSPSKTMIEMNNSPSKKIIDENLNSLIK